MPELLYDNLVEGAAERAVETGTLDLVDIASAVSAGFCASTFQADVERLADEISTNNIR